MQRRIMIGGGLVASAAALVAGGLWWRQARRGPALPPPRDPVGSAALEAALQPMPAPDRPLRVYHLGHSLVGRDMPAMLAQMAGHDHASQLGWGATLRQHWEDALEIPGFDTENAHSHFRPAHEAIASGEYDAIILTEMIGLREAIRYHASPFYLARWAEAARAGNPAVRLYLYETWHRLDEPEGFLERLADDLFTLWKGQLKQGAMAWGQEPPHLIPGGQVLRAAVLAAEAGQFPGLSSRDDFFRREADGTVDPIHLNDLGHYLIALAHYAVLYHRSPLMLPAQVTRADGAQVSIDPDQAARLQALVWDVVRRIPATGLAQG
jgi:hypothetical protein